MFNLLQTCLFVSRNLVCPQHPFSRVFSNYKKNDAVYNRVMKKFFILLIGIMWSGVAAACSFAPGSPVTLSSEENYPNFDNVTIVTIEQKNELIGRAGTEYVLRVDKSYKGNSPNKIRVTSPGHSCGFFGSVGQTFVWMTNDTNTIEEGQPKYFYESVTGAIRSADSVFLPKASTSIDQGTVCLTVYQPVCADLVVQCIQAPCYPIRSTYASGCEAEAAGAKVVSRSACTYEGPIRQKEPQPPVRVVTEQDKPRPRADEEKQNQPGEQFGPTVDPRFDIREPQSPPPYQSRDEDNSVQDLLKEEKSWWQRFVTWISGLFR